MKLQFRLRTLMIVVTLLAVPLGWQAKIVRKSGGQFGIPDQTLLRYEPLPAGRGN
jgi:hypothetical protein